MPTAAAIAAIDALGSRSDDASATRQARTSASVRSGAGWAAAKVMSPVVMVPVLSRHSTSTRASTSTVDRCLARALRRASATIPAMNDRLVSSTNPSGTIATAAATVPSSASCQRSSASSRLTNKKIEATGMITVSQRRIVSMPRRSADCATANCLASVARVLA